MRPNARHRHGTSAIFIGRRYIYVRPQPRTTGKPCYFCHSDEHYNGQRCKLQTQPVPLPCRRNTRINDRHLHNVPGVPKLAHQSRLRGVFSTPKKRQNFFQRRLPRGLIGHRDSPRCVAHRNACTRDMIVVMAT